MTGVAVRGKDKAGGAQKGQANLHFRIGGDPVVTIGDTVEPHGDHAPAPAMVEGEGRFRIGGRAVCRAEHKASCGHATTGRQRFRILPAQSQYRPYILPSWLPCNVEHIPWIMRAHGWHRGAKLMDQWLSNPASTDKEANPPDTTTITMDFVLRYADAQQAYDDLQDTSKWTIENDATRSPIDRLCQSLSRRSLLTNHQETFDDFNQPVPNLKGLQFDRRGVRTEGIPPLDDLGASLGAFDLLLVAAGSVRPLPDGSNEITITKAGVFAEDQYDFVGVQPLGFWDIDRHEVSTEWFEGACPVENALFRTWRFASGYGADYYVFSDLKVTTFDPPLIFYCQPSLGPL